jgi:hypothetical protein
MPEFGVARKDLNTINVTKVPLIFVPGVMGSRLDFPPTTLHWDPDNVGLMKAWAYMSADTMRLKISAIDQGATVATTLAEGIPALDSGSESGRGWEGVAWAFYGGFLQTLNRRSWGGAICPVYAVGYDWRQSNFVSGRRLGQEVNRILKKEQVEQVIIITHSMGGLVTRAAVHSVEGFSARVLGIVHVVQPASGGAVLYRRFFTGATPDFDDEPKHFRYIIGSSAKSTAAIMSALVGPMQLLPTATYRDLSGDANTGWLFCNASSGDKIGWQADVFDLYKSSDSPPGLIRHADYSKGSAREVKTDLMLRVFSAKNFHEALKLEKHPNTWSIYGIGLETDMGAAFDEERKFQYVRRAAPDDGGDGTVPWPSGAALFPDEVHYTGDATDPLMGDKNRQFEIANVNHGDAFNVDGVRQLVFNLVSYMIHTPKMS